MDTDVAHPFEYARYLGHSQVAHLDVLAGGDVHRPVLEFPRDGGDLAHLEAGERPARQPQPEHECPRALRPMEHPVPLHPVQFVLADLLARQFILRRPLRDLFSFWGLSDLLVIISLLVTIWGEGLAFMRVLRLYRVFHSPQTIDQLRDEEDA